MVLAGDLNAIRTLLGERSITPVFDGPERQRRYTIASDAYYDAWTQIKQEERE